MIKTHAVWAIQYKDKAGLVQISCCGKIGQLNWTSIKNSLELIVLSSINKVID